MDNLKRYEDIFKKVFDVTSQELNEEFTFAVVEKWDSFKHLVLITELEEAFNVLFESEDILHFESYQNGIKILKRYGVKIDEME